MGAPIPFDQLVNQVKPLIIFFVLYLVVSCGGVMLSLFKVDSVIAQLDALISALKFTIYVLFAFFLLYLHYDPVKGSFYMGLPKEVTMEQSFVIGLAVIEAVASLVSIFKQS